MISCQAVTDETGGMAWPDGTSSHHLRIEVGSTQINYDLDTGVLTHRVYGAGKRSDRKTFEWSLNMTALMKSLYR